jgi:hypothetical protein
MCTARGKLVNPFVMNSFCKKVGDIEASAQGLSAIESPYSEGYSAQSAKNMDALGTSPIGLSGSLGSGCRIYAAFRWMISRPEKMK